MLIVPRPQNSAIERVQGQGVDLQGVFDRPVLADSDELDIDLFGYVQMGVDFGCPPEEAQVTLYTQDGEGNLIVYDPEES